MSMGLNSQNDSRNTFTFIAGIATGFIMVGTGWLAVVLEVFIRWNFGERYLTVQRVISAAIWLVIINASLNIFNIVPNMVFSMFGFGSGESFNIFSVLLQWPVVLFLLVAIGHLIYIQWRKFFGAPVYSMSNGESWLFQGLGNLLLKVDNKYIRFIAVRGLLNDWICYLVIEPAFWFFIGAITSNFSPFFGGWIMGASAGMALRNHSLYQIKNRRLLDMMDAHIEATQMSKAIAGRPKQETAGFSIVRVSKRQQEFLESTDFATTVKETMRRGGFHVTQTADIDPPMPPTN